MKKVSVIGLFCDGKEVFDGQSIKTRIVTQELEKALGTDQVRRIDTFGWKKNPGKLFFNCIKSVYEAKNIVFMTDAGGIKIFPWLLTCANVFAKRPIHYVVIGGWLVRYIENHKLLAWFLKRLSGIFVETQVMKKGLEKLGFGNVYLMPNFKDLTLLQEFEIAGSLKEPYRFCIFSRIMREKGIEHAVNAVQNINARYGRTVCTLDLYGQVDSNQTKWFEQYMKTFSDAVRYGGIIPFDKSVDVLKEYCALLFPTQFYTEGIPGTIIDAYAAALPVVASEWESVFDIVEPGVTGITYSFDKPEALEDCLTALIEDPGQISDMKKYCLKKAEQYLPNAVVDILISKLL
jgi:glycosyltransferase involved in cell wall biosynthesis